MADKEVLLKGQTGELWKALCAQAAEEQDPEKLLQLVKEFNRLLASQGRAKTRRLT